MAPRIDGALKMPRSSLTETMRSLGASAAGGSPRPDNPRSLREYGAPGPISPEMKGFMPKSELANMRAWRPGTLCSGAPPPGPSGIRTEIQQILGSGAGGARDTNKTSAIFGCSPPSRAINPLSRDSTFTGGRRSTDRCAPSVLYPPPAGCARPGTPGCT